MEIEEAIKLLKEGVSICDANTRNAAGELIHAARMSVKYKEALIQIDKTDDVDTVNKILLEVLKDGD